VTTIVGSDVVIAGQRSVASRTAEAPGTHRGNAAGGDEIVAA